MVKSVFSDEARGQQSWEYGDPAHVAERRESIELAVEAKRAAERARKEAIAAKRAKMHDLVFNRRKP